jgi:hypothetical protein
MTEMEHSAKKQKTLPRGDHTIEEGWQVFSRLVLDSGRTCHQVVITWDDHSTAGC